ncbi:MAG: hypothetical protein ABL877_12400 [Thiobacillus sp.]
MFKKQWPAFLLAFVLPIVAVFWWWGGFATVTVSEAVAEPTRFAYLDYEGPISNLRKAQRAALEKFTAAKTEAGDTLSVILVDPRSHQGKTRAQVGYGLAEGVPLPAGLKEGSIAKRPVLRARVQAAVLLAPSKAYQALADQRGGEAAIRMPAVERYRPAGQADRVGVFTLEVDR